jgi:hypothetical protein
MPFFLLAVGAVAVSAREANAEPIQAYAAACASKTTAIAPFNCMDGVEIPMTGTIDNCVKPPYLPDAYCGRGSRIGIAGVDDKNGAIAVFLCRRRDEGRGAGSDKLTNFDDIAIIQTSLTNGATCFYQNAAVGRWADGERVPSPLDDDGFWKSPDPQDAPCVRCHDAGLIRTPYVTQVLDQQELVGKPYEQAMRGFLTDRRPRQYYWFPGEAYSGWNGNVERVTVDGNACLGCHSMGTISNEWRNRYGCVDASRGGCGTTRWLAQMAVGVWEFKRYLIEEERVPGYEKRAFWMSPRVAAATSQPGALETTMDDEKKRTVVAKKFRNEKLDQEEEDWTQWTIEETDEQVEREKLTHLRDLIGPSQAAAIQLHACAAGWDVPGCKVEVWSRPPEM